MRDHTQAVYPSPVIYSKLNWNIRDYYSIFLPNTFITISLRQDMYEAFLIDSRGFKFALHLVSEKAEILDKL